MQNVLTVQLEQIYDTPESLENLETEVQEFMGRLEWQDEVARMEITISADQNEKVDLRTLVSIAVEGSLERMFESAPSEFSYSVVSAQQQINRVHVTVRVEVTPSKLNYLISKPILNLTLPA
jgi:hypothetical protein